jgi:hypothetical protein
MGKEKWKRESWSQKSYVCFLVGPTLPHVIFLCGCRSGIATYGGIPIRTLINICSTDNDGFEFSIMVVTRK